MKAISIYSDFDATISIKDVGDELFTTFGSWNILYDKFVNGECNVRELNKMLCNSLRNDLTFEEISAFAIAQEIDANVKKFVNFCNENNINFTIVSDGYDAYIKPILQYHQLDYLPVYCNSLVKKKCCHTDLNLCHAVLDTASPNYLEGIPKQVRNDIGLFEPVFYGAVDGCLCPTASCKRNVVVNNSTDDDIVVYIGDGHTDYCGAEHSDIVFAKSRLAAYCSKNRIPHHPFNTFFDIYRILEKKIKNNELHHRHQAKMKRKTAFEIE